MSWEKESSESDNSDEVVCLEETHNRILPKAIDKNLKQIQSKIHSFSLNLFHSLYCAKKNTHGYMVTM